MPDRDTPAPTDAAARRRMRSQRQRDTKPEVQVRRLLHRAGLRFRVDYPPLPGLGRRADIVFTKAKVAVFVDGCFWHGCPEHGTQPKGNAAWWTRKLATNKLRDEDTNIRLEAAGWLVVRVWEHEYPAGAARRVEATVRARRHTLG